MKYIIEFELPDNETVLKEIKTDRVNWSIWGYSGQAKAKPILKEQKIGQWILLGNCSNSGVYCSECHTKVFDNYPFKKKFSYFCPHCGTRMETKSTPTAGTNEIPLKW